MGPLRDGQTVAIVGAGPAGASCAIALKHLAAQRKMTIKVLIYESKDFQEESQCNQCAGLLSPPIAEVLEDRLGIPFPYDLVQRRTHDYLLVGGEETIRLAGRAGESFALRRIQFDRYLLRQAILAGAEWVRSKVQDVQIHSAGVRIVSEEGSRTADAVVGAFGLDEATARAFRRTTGYAPPPCIQTLVTKLHPPPEQMAGYGHTVYTFLPPIRNVEFAAVIPKGNHLTIVEAGKKLTGRAMDQLLAWRPLQEIVPVGQCREQPPTYYQGSFPTALGRRIYGDRYVMIGDASGLVRPFKGKGVTTACITGHLAAKTMMDRGISHQALDGFQRQCQELVEDIFFGRLVRLMVGVIHGSGTVDEIIRQARSDEGIRDAMYCCVSGEGAYKTMLARTASVGRAVRIGKAVFCGLLSLPFRKS
jgi:flavin-dependent dehydrogenase